MYKHLLWLLIILLSITVIFQSKIERESGKNQLVKKSITFTLRSDKNYAANVYRDALAQPRIIIHKLKADTKTVVWDKTYDFKRLQDYSLQNGMSETVVVNNLNRKEKLEVTCVLTYYSKGSVLQMYNDTVFNPGMKSGAVAINL